MIPDLPTPDGAAPGGQPRLHLAADLTLDIDGVAARISGQGQELNLTSEHPFALWRAALRSVPDELRRGSPRGTVRAVADTLAAHELTVNVAAPGGAQVRIGAAARSALTDRLVGSSHVSLATKPGQLRRVVVATVAVAAVPLTLRLVRNRIAATGLGAPSR